MKKKTALITGASSGIGFELANIHAINNGDLVLVARRKDTLLNIKADLEKKHGVSVEIIAIDLTQKGAVEEVCKILKEKNITIDYLINNAGIGEFGFFQETNWDKESAMIELNIKTLTHLTKVFVKDMIERGSGKIMNVASTAAFQPGPLMAVYYATKHYVLAFSEAIANELIGTGVTITTLCPGPTDSEFLVNANLQESMLFARVKIASSEKVAKYGYRQMLKGNTVAIQGLLNSVIAFSIRFIPRKLAVSIVRKTQEKSSVK